MEDIKMDQEKRIQDATDLAMNYQLAINKGELDKAFEMVLPKEREAVSKEAFIKEKLGVDTIIEGIGKYHPDIGTFKLEEATYDEKSKKYRISVKERYPDAKELDGSGIWDTPYVVYENTQDLPFTKFKSFYRNR